MPSLPLSEPADSAAPPSGQRPALSRGSLHTWTSANASIVLAKYAATVGAEARRLRGAAERTQALGVDDLEAEGRIAVLEAVGTFEGWGVNETTWVRMRIRQRMVDAVRRQSIWTREDTRVMARDRKGEELVPEARRRADAASSRRLVAIDGPQNQAHHTLASMLPAPNQRVDDFVDALRDQTRLRAALADLPARMQRVVERILFEGASNSVVAAELGVSASRVSQLLRSAVETLRGRLAPAA